MQIITYSVPFGRFPETTAYKEYNQYHNTESNGTITCSNYGLAELNPRLVKKKGDKICGHR